MCRLQGQSPMAWPVQMTLVGAESTQLFRGLCWTTTIQMMANLPRMALTSTRYVDDMATCRLLRLYSSAQRTCSVPKVSTVLVSQTSEVSFVLATLRASVRLSNSACGSQLCRPLVGTRCTESPECTGWCRSHRCWHQGASKRMRSSLQPASWPMTAISTPQLTTCTTRRPRWTEAALDLQCRPSGSAASSQV